MPRYRGRRANGAHERSPSEGVSRPAWRDRPRTISGQATGRTDVPLTERDADDAEGLAARLKGSRLTQVLTSALRERIGLRNWRVLVNAKRPRLNYRNGTTAHTRASAWRPFAPSALAGALFEDGCPGGRL